MKRMKILPLILSFVITLGFTVSALGESLTREQILARAKGSKSILVLSGDFDPVGEKQLQFIQNKLKDPNTLILLTPTIETRFRMLTPISTRIHMLDTLFSQNPNVVYLKEDKKLQSYGKLLFLQKIFSQNIFRKIKIEKIPLEQETFQLTLKVLKDTSISLDQKLTQLGGILAPSVASIVLQSGLYMDINSSKRVPMSIYLTQKVGEAIRSTVLLATGSDLKQLAKSKPIDDKIMESLHLPEIEIEKYLDSGTANSAFIVKIAGEKALLKVSKRIPRFENDLLNTVRLFQWLTAMGEIHIPRLIQFDLEEKWAILEFVSGISLKKRLEKGPVLTTAEIESMRELFEFSKKTYLEAGVRLDLDVDNIIMKDERAYVVDPGPSPRWLHFEKDFQKFYQQLLKKYVKNPLLKAQYQTLESRNSCEAQFGN